MSDFTLSLEKFIYNFMTEKWQAEHFAPEDLIEAAPFLRSVARSSLPVHPFSGGSMKAAAAPTAEPYF